MSIILCITSILCTILFFKKTKPSEFLNVMVKTALIASAAARPVLYWTDSVFW